VVGNVGKLLAESFEAISKNSALCYIRQILYPLGTKSSSGIDWTINQRQALREAIWNLNHRKPDILALI